MLSKRLKTIANMIDDTLIYDIGCDHALLDIYLTKEKNIKCIGIDVNETIINRAINNVKKYHLEDKIELRIENGFNDLELNKKHTMVISGMGSKNIIKILEKNKTDKIIIQSNNKPYLIRKYLVKLGYKIVSEDIVLKKTKYYVIIKFEKGISNYTLKDYILGPILSKRTDNIYYQYLKEYNKYIFKEKEYNEIIKKQLEKI